MNNKLFIIFLISHLVLLSACSTEIFGNSGGVLSSQVDNFEPIAPTNEPVLLPESPEVTTIPRHPEDILEGPMNQETAAVLMQEYINAYHVIPMTYILASYDPVEGMYQGGGNLVYSKNPSIIWPTFLNVDEATPSDITEHLKGYYQERILQDIWMFQEVYNKDISNEIEVLFCEVDLNRDGIEEIMSIYISPANVGNTGNAELTIFLGNIERHNIIYNSLGIFYSNKEQKFKGIMDNDREWLDLVNSYHRIIHSKGF